MSGSETLALVSPVAALAMLGLGAYCGKTRNWSLLVGFTLAWLLICYVTLRGKL